MKDKTHEITAEMSKSNVGHEFNTALPLQMQL